MDEVFFRALAESLGRYLAMVAHSDDQHAVRLAAAWRAILRRHRPTPAGACPGCVRARREMCTVWRVAVGYFLGNGPSGRAPRR